LLASLPANASPDVWALNFNQNIFVVDVASNAELPFIPSPVVSDALAADLSGVLYVADSAGDIFSVQGSVNLGSTGFTGIADLYYASGGLWGFDDASDTVFFFDLGSTSVTYSLPITSGLGTHTITGVTRRAATGELFLSGYTALNADSLFVLDLNTASASLVGAIVHSDNFSYVSDIEFDGFGTLYAMTWYHRDFYTVNPASGAATFLSAGPHRDATGFAVDPSLVPEPGTWMAGVLAGAVAAGIALRRGPRIARMACVGKTTDCTDHTDGM
jgi:hypothetical protein